MESFMPEYALEYTHECVYCGHELGPDTDIVFYAGEPLHRECFQAFGRELEAEADYNEWRD